MPLTENISDRIYEGVFLLCTCLFLFVLTWSCWIHILLLCVMYACVRQIRTQKRELLDANSKAVLITGCDTGFGHHLAKRLDDVGFTVFAGVLSESSDGAIKLRSRKSKKLNVIKLDVTSEEEVLKAAEYVKTKRGDKGLWGLVNNAGVNIYNDVEFATIEQYKKVAEVNLYGLIRVTKACLPLIRKSKGRIVNFSSVKGRYAWPSDSIYHVTKYGVETLSDSLRLEMRKFKVKVAIIEPGSFDGATSCSSPIQLERMKSELESSWESASEEVKSAYGRGHLENVYDGLKGPFPELSPDPVLNAVEDALLNTSPSSRYLVHGNSGKIIDEAACLAEIYGVLPTPVSDFIIAWLTKCDKIHTISKAKVD